MLYQHDCLSVFPSDHRAAVDPFCSVALLFMPCIPQTNYAFIEQKVSQMIQHVWRVYSGIQSSPCYVDTDLSNKSKHTQEDKHGELLAVISRKFLILHNVNSVCWSWHLSLWDSCLQMWCSFYHL